MNGAARARVKPRPDRISPQAKVSDFALSEQVGRCKGHSGQPALLEAGIKRLRFETPSRRRGFPRAPRPDIARTQFQGAEGEPGIVRDNQAFRMGIIRTAAKLGQDQIRDQAVYARKAEWQPHIERPGAGYEIVGYGVKMSVQPVSKYGATRPGAPRPPCRGQCGRSIRARRRGQRVVERAERHWSGGCVAVDENMRRGDAGAH